MSPLQYVGRRLATFLARPRERNSHIPTSPWGLLAATLRKGDVVLVEGSSRFASAIKYLTQSTWSHAALYIGDALGPPAAGEEPRVLVDVDVVDGVRTIPLSAFAGLHTRICRPVGLSPAEVDALVGFMLARSGVTYDLKNIFDLARYDTAVALLERVDLRQAVGVYVRFHPLFQQAYRDIAPPGTTFNDRLVAVIDHLLAAPEVEGPVEVHRASDGSGRLRFADPRREGASVGHKAMWRIGPDHAARVKARLRELRAILVGQAPTA